jgi:hypothetical protein
MRASKATDLSESQLKAAGLLSTGLSIPDTAQAIGVHRRTINRWLEFEVFKAEVDRLKQQSLDAHRQKVDEVKLQEIGSFYDELKKYREQRMELYRAKLQLGNEILAKTHSRLSDLPEESIVPNCIPQMIKAADDLTENALRGIAELIGLNAVMERLNNEEQV